MNYNPYRHADLDTEEYPFIALDTPGLPQPGPDFLAEADRLVDYQPPAKPKRRGKMTEADHLLADAEDERILLAQEELDRDRDRALRYLYCRALYHNDFILPVTVKGRPVDAAFIPGHLWGFEADGPRPATVMVIGKRPGDHELAQRRNFVGPSSAYLIKALEEIGVPREEYENWYVTNLVRHDRLDPASDTLAANWIKNCMPLLYQEIMIIRPKYILCLGGEAAKQLLGKGINVTNMTGRVAEFTYMAPFANSKPPLNVEYTAQVMVVPHPAYVARKPEAYDGLRDGVSAFYNVVQGARIGDVEDDIRHEVIYTERHLTRIVDELLQRRETIFAVDAEWQGKHPNNEGSYLRTIQFSPQAKEAYCVVLHSEGGAPAFQGDWLGPLRRLLKHSRNRHVRIGGHWFRADLPWLKRYGLDLEPEYTAAATPEETKHKGGWDTGPMVHAAFETLETYKLENLCMRWTTCPRWDIDLQKWKDDYCKKHQLKDKELEGYGQCPDDVLHPYANYDADGTRRLFDVFNGIGDAPGFLDKDMFGNNCRAAFHNNHRATHAALEMEMAGVEVNRERADALIETFNDVKNIKTAELQATLNWPDFNPRSANQCREFLFGQHLNGAIDKLTGKNRRLRPYRKRGLPAPISLGLTPIKPAGNGAKGMTWEAVVRDGKTHIFNPSTDKETLGILGHVDPRVMRLRDVRFLQQVMQSVIRLPKTIAGEVVLDDDGVPLHEGGLLYYIDDDARVRSHFYPVETGRWSSSRPNLQNLSKRREADYKRILADRYLYPIRSMLQARPGCVLIEADLKSAELAGIAWFSGDPTMIEHVRCNMLDEGDADYIDIHSRTACRAFNLDCEPTKAGLESIGKIHLRVAAKNVNFGIPYQRGAVALARQCREEGCNVTDAEAEMLKDAYFQVYPGTFGFLEECKSRVSSPGWLQGAFGRYRRFQAAEEEKILADQQRQACNFPIQNLVADAINVACWNITQFRERYQGPHTFRTVLQIHDALLFEVPYESVEWMIDEVIPTVMSAQVPIQPCYLDGTPMPIEEPYYFGVDTEVMTNWGEKLTREKALSFGLPDHKRFGVPAAKK